MTTIGTHAVVDALRARVTEVVVPGDVDYDDARRVWNGMVDRRPLAVVRARTPAEVAATVTVVAEHGVPLAVRGGGHGVVGNGTVDDGVVLDLRALSHVEVDAEARTVRVGGGATLAELDRATEPYGLAVPVGVVSMTGVGGLTLGGGMGWLTRAYGLTVDNLLDADVVTAEGQVVRASDDPELLWGLKGGGGNFGVVTSFTFRAYPLGPAVHAGNLVYGLERWREALRAWEAWTRDLPDAMQSVLTLLTPPAVWEIGTDPVLVVGFAWSGADRSEGERHADALRAAAPPDVEEVGDVPWTAWQSAVDELLPRGSRACWRNTSFDRFDDEVLDVLIRRGAEQTWYGTAFDVHHMGGAYARVPQDATAFPTRDARYWLNVYGFWSDPADDDARVAFVRGFGDEMAPLATGGQYVNFMGAEAVDAPAAARAVWGAATLRRLAGLKRRYDPDNLFRLNHNVLPAEAPAS